MWGPVGSVSSDSGKGAKGRLAASLPLLLNYAFRPASRSAEGADAVTHRLDAVQLVLGAA
jgi:hypothetical protein